MAAKKTKEVPVQNQTDSTSTVRMEAKFIPEDNFPENDEKMAQMTEEEILEEQRRLIEKLDAITVQFLKTRRSGKGKSSGNLHREPERRSKGTENDHFMDFTSQEASELNSRIGRISTDETLTAEDVNKETGEFLWASDLPEPDPNKSYSVRFDLWGNFVTDSNLPTHLGLHHHGQEPEVPGYTIEELFMLCKSANVQQKSLALKTLSCICANARLGQFVQQLHSNVFEHLLDSGLAMLSRLMLDQSNLNLICQAVQSLWSVLYSPATESIQEVFYLCSSDVSKKFLPAKSKSFKISQKSDPESAMKTDIIRGLVDTNLLNRFRYVLEVVKPPFETCVTILDILVKFTSHSQAVANSVFECPRLLNFIVQEFLNLSRSFDLITFKTLRLLSLLAASQIEIASHLILTPNFGNFLLFCIGDDSNERPRTDNEVTGLSLLVKAESWQLCHVLIAYNLFMDQIISLTQLIILRLNRFQLVELSKCSATDLRFLTLFIDFCSQLLRNFIRSGEIWLSCRSDIIEIIHILLNKWTSEISVELEYFCDSIHLACISSLWKLIFTALSEVHRLSISPEMFEKFDLLRHFKAWSTVMSNLQLNKLVENWPYGLTNAESIVDAYFCLNVEKCQFYSLDLANSYLKLVTLFQLTNRLDAGKDMADFMNNVVEVLSKFVFKFMNMKFVVYEGLPENSCGYHVFSLVVELVYHSLSLLSTRKVGEDLPSKVLLSVCLKCIANCPGNGNLVEKLLKFLFNSKFYDSQQTEHLALKLARIYVQGSPNSIKSGLWIPEKPQDILKAAEHLYLLELQNVVTENKSENVDDCLLFNWSAETAMNGPLLPQDWVFLTILDETTEDVEPCPENDHLECPQNMTKLEKVQTSLNFIALLVSELQSIDCLMAADLIFVRLMHVFMMGNEVFMDKTVERVIEYLFKQLYGRVSLPNECAGLTSFHDYYMSFLEYFEAESFGHILFSNFLLLPMCAKFSFRYRRAVWIEHTAIFKVLRMEKEELLFPLEMLCGGDPQNRENEGEVLKAQSVCLSGDILDKCPILKHVASAATSAKT